MKGYELKKDMRLAAEWQNMYREEAFTKINY
jgi:hypothetical protein